MRIVAVIPARYGSSRFPGKPLVDLCGKPMIWWVCQQLKKVRNVDETVVATDDERIVDVCMQYGVKVVLTSKNHNTPTSRLYEVSTRMDGDKFVFVGGDEPMINPESIEKVVDVARKEDSFAVNAMTRIKTAPEVIDFTNIKVVVNTDNILLYTSRSPIPFPKGGLDFEYMKFVGIGVFSREALDFYNDTPKTDIERIEECDLLRFVERGKPVKMVYVESNNVSIDTPKDLELARVIMQERINSGKI
jgi:3-deoxy-manno-octulosonate cytidylyltransferase (CMP-KDO synthetase)